MTGKTASRPFGAVALALGIGFAGAAGAQGNVLLTFGALDASGAAVDRSYASLAASMGLGRAATLHFELAAQSREEDAGYVALGLSRDFGGGSSAKLLIGTSDSALGIYPELAVDASYQFDTGPGIGRLYRLGVAYGDYAPGNTSTRLSGEVVQYFPPRADGSYFVGQLGGALTLADPGSELGWEVSAVGTLVRPGGTALGLELAAGSMAYDLIPAIPVTNNFYAVRPFVSFSVTDRAEIILRGEYINSDLYDLSGASLGVKLGF